MMEYVLITGASRGIGKAIAIYFAKNNHNVVIVSKNNYDALLQTKTEVIQNNVNCIAFQCDVSSYDEIQKLKNHLYPKNIFISCIINNAGICHYGLLQDLSPEEWNNIINTNLSSVFYTSKCFLEDMIKRKAGSIINISSVWGVCGASCEVAYSTTKGGINAFTKALAKELAPSHIAVNAIACGAIDTDMNNHLSPDDKEALENEIPYGCMGSCEDVARLVYNVYTSPNYMTGQIIVFDGGWI